MRAGVGAATELTGVRTAFRGWGGQDAYDGRVDNFWVAVAWSILPTIVVVAAFFFVFRSIVRMDRTERRVHARIEAEERAKRGLPPVAAASDS